MEIKLYNSRVNEIYSSKILKLKPEISLKSAVKKMMEENLREIIVFRFEETEERIIGILTATDILEIKRKNCDINHPISDYMKTNVITVDANDLIKEAKELMSYYEIERLPVYDKKIIVGIVHIKNVLECYSKLLESVSEQYAPILDQMYEGIAVTNQEGYVVIWNRKSEEMYGISAKEILNRKMEDFFPNALALSVLETKKAIKNKYHSPKEGSFAVISASPFFVKGEFLGVVSTDRDITDYINKTLELENANSELNLLKGEVEKITGDFSSMKHISRKNAKMEKVIQLARRIAPNDTCILVTGESGTGKEVLSRAIHLNSGRKGHFVPVNCSAIPRTLFESEFFGYVGGAFTGALQNGKMGYFELANGGTLFLDELGDLPLDVQAKLLRVIQDGVIMKVGANKSIQVDVRIISATNKDLGDMVKRGEFREDLYYRLNVLEIKIPPLRERKEDLIMLFKDFMDDVCKKNNLIIDSIDNEVFDIMLQYDWKGNIRELRNTVEYMVIFGVNQRITKESIPDYIMKGALKKILPDYLDSLNLENTLKSMEVELITKAMEKAHGNKAEASKFLGIPRSTLYYKLALYGF